MSGHYGRWSLLQQVKLMALVAMVHLLFSTYMKGNCYQPLRLPFFDAHTLWCSCYLINLPDGKLLQYLELLKFFIIPFNIALENTTLECYIPRVRSLLRKDCCIL